MAAFAHAVDFANVVGFSRPGFATNFGWWSGTPERISSRLQPGFSRCDGTGSSMPG
jgi:hypothetical protein